MKTEENINPSPPAESEIDFIALLKILWNGRKIMIWCLIIFVALGIIEAMTSPNVYTASTIMVPQVQTKGGSLSGLGGLAAMAGINLNDMGSISQEMSPLLYPQIVKSYPFQKEVIYAPLKWNSFNEPMSLFEHSKKISKPTALSIVKKYTIGLPGVIMSLPDIVRSRLTAGKVSKEVVENFNDSLFPIKPDERALCDALSGTLSLAVDNKNGYIVLSAMGPEPLMTAQLADKAQKLLQEKITEYRIDKAKKNLAFVQERYNEKKKEFESAQDRLAHFRDRNLNMTSNTAKTEEERLQSEYQLAFSVYSELAKQLEGSKIRVKEDTPIFSIIQPVSVPLVRTKPNKPKIVFIWFVLGGTIGLGLIFGRRYLKEMKKKWTSHETIAIV